VPTAVAPPCSSLPASGFAPACEAPGLVSHPKRTLLHRLDAVTYGGPGWVHNAKLQMGTGPHCSPAAPLYTTTQQRELPTHCAGSVMRGGGGEGEGGGEGDGGGGDGGECKTKR
jgi:hypothetical protein